jgi:hypothetical protein
MESMHSKRRFVNLKNPLRTLINFREYLKLWRFGELHPILSDE